MPRTFGRVQHTVMDHRIYLKPALKKAVVRTAGVNRVSTEVLKRNKEFKRVIVDIIKACRGKPWNEFRACLSEEAIEKLGLSKSKEMGQPYSKTLEYRKENFWKHKE